MKGVGLDRGKFDAQLGKLEASLGREVDKLKSGAGDKVRLAAVKASQDLAEKTFPTADTVGIAIAAMRADINRVFITDGRAYEILRASCGGGVAGAFYACVKNGDMVKAQRIIRESGSPIREIEIGTLKPELHEKSRSDQTGRVMVSRPLQIVSKTDLENYINERLTEIGKTAAGWNACAVKLGGSEAGPRWKSTGNHGTDGGSVTIVNDSGSPVILVRNEMPLARKNIAPGVVTDVLKGAREYLLKLLAG